MALPASGTLSASQINVELGLAAGAAFSMNDAAVRGLAGKPSGLISFSDLLGKANGIYNYSFIAGISNNYKGYMPGAPMGTGLSVGPANAGLSNAFMYLDPDIASVIGYFTIQDVANMPRWKEVRKMVFAGYEFTGVFSQSTDYKTGLVSGPWANFIPGGTVHLDDQYGVLPFIQAEHQTQIAAIYNALTIGATYSLTFK